jgi:hypothetical protein
MARRGPRAYGPSMAFRSVSLDQLIIDDERSVAHVALYHRLKRALRRSDHRFVIPAVAGEVSWDRALFLNLTYWSGQRGSDVLCDEHIPADVVAHVAWHEVVSRQLARRAVVSAAAPSPAALFFAESIASAFDLYLVGRLLDHAPDSDFIVTQVPLMAERAQAAGLSETAFAALMEEVAQAPERAFEDLRALLLDVPSALLPCRDVLDAQEILTSFAGHRFGPLLHHYELSNWVLYARAHADRSAGPDQVVAAMDRALRTAPVALDSLAEQWIDADDEDAAPAIS